MARFDKESFDYWHTKAQEFRAGHGEMHDVLTHHERLSQSANPLDVYSVYISLLEQSQGDDDLKADIHAFLDDYLALFPQPNIEIVCETEMSPDEQRIAKLFMLTLKSTDNGNIDDYDNAFDNFVNSLQGRLNKIYDQWGNTPLVWGVANSNCRVIHKVLDAIDRAQLHNVAIDTHFKQYSKGTALFLACVKGESHRDDALNPPLEARDYLGSVIKRLLDAHASPQERCESYLAFSSLEVMALRHSPEMTSLMLSHLDSPLSDRDLDRLKLLATQVNYGDAGRYLDMLCTPNTFPAEAEWNNNTEEMLRILDNYKLQRDGHQDAVHRL